jgi:hypothetical protein
MAPLAGLSSLQCLRLTLPSQWRPVGPLVSWDCLLKLSRLTHLYLCDEGVVAVCLTIAGCYGSNVLNTGIQARGCMHADGGCCLYSHGYCGLPLHTADSHERTGGA